MRKTPDICIQENSEEMVEKATELGWKNPEAYETLILEAENWGELKNKLRDNREEYDILVFKGGNEKLNRDAVSDQRLDVLLHPERNRKDSGMDSVVARKAAENNVAIGFDLKQLLAKPKKQVHVLSHWRKNLMLCEKHGAKYIITTNARKKQDLRSPRDLASVLDSIGFSGRKALETSEQILGENTNLNKEGEGSE